MSAASKLPRSGDSSNGSSGNARFNAEATAWDANPFVHAASQHACAALLQHFPLLSQSNPTLDILEIGCGTGLLTFLLAPYAGSITAVDASWGMVDVLKRKIEEKRVENVTGVCVLLEDPEDEALPPMPMPRRDADVDAESEADAVAPGEKGKAGRMKFDLITSHLVLHHIPDLEGVLRTMRGCLKEGGWVALTDFEDEGPQSRCFHARSRMEGVERDGIGRERMAELMRELGFKEVEVKVAWRMEKRVERWEGEFGSRGRGGEGEGQIGNFPFVLCLGRR